MATLLEKLQSWIDPKLEETFYRKAYDPAKDREWVVSRLQSAKTQFAATETTRGGGLKLWKLANGVVAFSPIRPDKQPLIVNGKSTVFVPSEHFAAFLDTMAEAVRAGEFDAELSSNTTAGTSVALDTKPARKPRAAKPAGEAGGRGWSEERKAKFAATIAARNAAKATENA